MDSLKSKIRQHLVLWKKWAKVGWFLSFFKLQKSIFLLWLYTYYILYFVFNSRSSSQCEKWFLMKKFYCLNWENWESGWLDPLHTSVCWYEVNSSVFCHNGSYLSREASQQNFLLIFFASLDLSCETIFHIGSKTYC